MPESHWGILIVAYLDPGTGSIIMQALIGAFLGALVALRMYWERIKAFFSNRGAESDRDDASDEQ